MGPACEAYEIIKELCKAGMNVARLNFSHGTHESHLKMIELLKEARKELNLPLSIMLDTKGPEYRIKTFKDGSIVLHEGDTFTFTADEVEGNQERVSVNYKDLPHDLEPGNLIYLNDGLLEFRVNEVKGNDIICTCLGDGKLSNRKSMSFPGKVLKQVYRSEQDKSDIKFGVEHGIDYIACSFVSCRQDLDDIRAYLDSIGGQDIKLIAKIENQAGVDNIDSIFESCSGVMVARGDMGVEIPYEKLPEIQKMMITKCRIKGKRSITATEMLESMITKPRPTRAEISDVANAVYDGTSAVMLSGETAAGDFPVEAVKAMAKIAEEAESAIDYTANFYDGSFIINDVADAVSHSTCDMAISLGAKAIVACTNSGETAKLVSRFRTPMEIIGLTPNVHVYRRLSLSWGVTPVCTEVFDTTEKMFAEAKRVAVEELNLQPGDKIVITSGITKDESSNLSVLSVETI